MTGTKAAPADPIRVLVVDDEPLARRGVRARLARVPDIGAVDECASGREAVAAIRRLAPDLVFLDVQMPGLDGFGVVEQVGPARMPMTVFVTAYDTYALRAFDAHALDYVLKPIDDDRFADAVSRARVRLAERRAGAAARELSGLIAEHRAVPSERAYLPVRDRGRIVVLEQSEIDWVAADGDYARLHAAGAYYLTRETLGAIEARLLPPRFVRVHRSAIVNVSRIRELRPLPNREYVLVLRDGVRLRCSRSYADRLLAVVGEAR